MNDSKRMQTNSGPGEIIALHLQFIWYVFKIDSHNADKANAKSLKITYTDVLRHMLVVGDIRYKTKPSTLECLHPSPCQ